MNVVLDALLTLTRPDISPLQAERFAHALVAPVEVTGDIPQPWWSTEAAEEG